MTAQEKRKRKKGRPEKNQSGVVRIGKISFPLEGGKWNWDRNTAKLLREKGGQWAIIA